MPEKSPYSREGEALHIVEHTVDEGVIPPQQERDLISAIAEALDEAHKAGSAAKDATIAEQAERIATLEQEAAKEDLAMTKVLNQRDKAEEAAYELAQGIATLLGVGIGEHTSHNDPIANAKSYLWAKLAEEGLS